MCWMRSVASKTTDVHARRGVLSSAVEEHPLALVVDLPGLVEERLFVEDAAR